MKEIITVQQRSGIKYAGIGARKTPKSIRKIMTSIGAMYAKDGHVLLSGGCEGPDTDFETGHAFIAPKNTEIFIPWDGYNKRSIKEYTVQAGACLESLIIAKKYYVHPNPNRGWNDLKYGTKKLMARNSYQVLGKDLSSPVHFVICWTPGGKVTGGTGQALRIANDYGIKVINLGIKEHLKWMTTLLKKQEYYNFKVIKGAKI